MRGVLVVVVLAGGGCFNPAPTPGAPCNTEGQCPSGLRCTEGLCVLPDLSDAGADPGDAMVDGCPVSACEGDELLACGERIACTNGCAAAGEGTDAHCKQFVPANGLTPALLEGVTADVTGEWNFDSDTGEIWQGTTIYRAAGTGVIAGVGFQIVDGMGVFTARSFHALRPDDWGGDGSNTLVLFAATTITIEGELDVGAFDHDGHFGGSNATSSATSSCRGAAGRAHGPSFGEGGGGGGGRSKGGDGAPSNVAGATGVGGSSCVQPSTIPLRGGNGGAWGDDSSSCSGGAGGGAVALVALESITVSGTVAAPGAGGESLSSCDGGGGGGSGGAVLLDAPIVTVTGEVTANGGGGGAPNGTNGARGETYTSIPAAGGLYNGRRGGRGAAGTTDPTAGQTYTATDPVDPTIVTMSRGGGGGGAAGRIELRATTLSTTGALVSPPAASSQPTYE